MVTVRCSLNKLESHYIGRKNGDKDTASPFGNFLELQTKEIHMVTGIVSEVLKYRVVPLKYRIWGIDLTFTPMDVALILGLRIGEVPKSFLLRKKTEVSDFRLNYFGKKTPPGAKEIKEALIRARNDPAADVDDVHRLNCLYLFAICLLPDSSKKVDVSLETKQDQLELLIFNNHQISQIR
ncbi:hypothetical protein AQUCO_00100897v1 [Aquilegia coerulea]|uniref:Aminotransferase-like plant mobile domain-containing protein n=1 Tax=Aquilegia coerulea TaxID=218851 RepID=A0A2G5FCL2_AQUCA|nr:hypothetical protein AQUCO_00100897v1 [Aquilegia coerulea]